VYYVPREKGEKRVCVGDERKEEKREVVEEKKGRRQVMKVKANQVNNNENQVTIIVIETDFKGN
jgi:hypothetical protein